MRNINRKYEPYKYINGITVFTRDTVTYTLDYKVIPSSKIDNRLKPNADKLKRLSKFYTDLEKSILEEGFRNPISTHNRGIMNGYITDFIGGSRLYIAQKHGLDIPCVISDFKRKGNMPLEEILTKFKDELREVLLTERGFIYFPK